MGTIPAPNIVADIASGQSAYNNTLNEYQRAAALQRDSAVQGQEMQQRAQQMEIQRRQLADQDALTKTLSQYDPAKHTIADIPKLITSNGGSGSAALQAQNSLIAQKQNYLKLSDDQFAQEQKKADAIQGVHDEVSEAEPLDKQNVYTNGLKKLAGLGVDVSQEPADYPGDQEFARHLPAIRLHSALVAEAEKDRELTTKEQEAQSKDWKDFPALGVALNTRTGEQKSVGGGAAMSPQMMEAKYVALEQKKLQGQPLSKEDAAWHDAYKNMKSIVPVANFNLQNAGAAADNNGNPSEIAKAVAENRMKWGEAVSPRTPQSVKNAIMSQVYRLNPNYDTSEFGLETDAAKKARSGAWADSRLAYNTAIDHSKQLLDTIDALNSGDVKKLNSLKNFFKTEFGSPDVPTFSAVANAYNHEVTSVISKNHITDAEVEAGHATLPDNASPQQLRGVVNAYSSLMQSKRDELDKIIKAGAGKKADAIINTQANEGGAGEKFSFKAPNNKIYHFPTQQALDDFKREAGIQ
jgi:uncharacterized protein YbjQ (UPF0145 family)